MHECHVFHKSHVFYVLHGDYVGYAEPVGSAGHLCCIECVCGGVGGM